jgi:hypothetical protein
MSVVGIPLQPGKTITLLPLQAREAGTYECIFAVDSDTVLLSTWVDSITGTLDATAYTFTDTGRETPLLQFTQLTSPTTQLIIEQPSGPTMSNIRLVVTTTGPGTWEFRARGVSGATGGKSSSQEDCNVILEEILIQNTGELVISDPACVIVQDGDAGRQMEIASGSTTTFR